MFAQKPAFVRPHRRRQASDTLVEVEKVGTLRYYVSKFKREFDYTSISSVLRPHLAVALAEAHIEYITRFARRTALSCYYALRRLVEGTSENRELVTQLRRLRTLQAEPGADFWRQAVAAHVANLEKRSIATTTFAEEIGNLFRGLDELASKGLAPVCVRPTLPKNYHAAGKHRPGLVEQSSNQPVAQELLAKLEAHIDSLNLPIKGEEAHELLRALAAQAPAEVLSDEAAVAEAIFSINAKALDEVRRAAEETFLHWRGVWLKGQELLQSEDPSVAVRVDRAKDLPKHLANAPRRALFSPTLGDAAVANFLRLLREKYGLQVPPEVERKWPAAMKVAFWNLGGREIFDACFSLHRKGVAAAVILYLVDSGANVSTALNLTTDSENESDDPGFVSFTSFKDRAGPHPIVKQLPLKADGVRISAGQALRDVKQMTASRRALHPQLLGDALFVFTYFGKPSVLTPRTLCDNFRYILRDKRLPGVYTPSAIRVAVGVEVSGKSNGDLDRVGRKLSHAVGSGATPIYALRLPVRLLLNRKMREYGTLLEVAFSTHAPRGPQTLGYRTDVADRLVGEAIRTGLGFLCSDATAKGGTMEQGSASCPELGKGCPDCHVRLFMADVESLSEMVAIYESLSKKLDEYEESKQEVWVEDWLDLYAFASAVIQRAKRSRFSHLMPAARRRAQQMLDAGFEPILVRE